MILIACPLTASLEACPNFSGCIPRCIAIDIRDQWFLPFICILYALHERHSSASELNTDISFFPSCGLSLVLCAFLHHDIPCRIDGMHEPPSPSEAPVICAGSRSVGACFRWHGFTCELCPWEFPCVLNGVRWLSVRICRLPRQ
ncbi:uncharacterized protein SCHCODRAFT_01249419 [Schizophyllum commune H4-8]|uniref:uncharacterized protein n=1 Tax=Schizophyllum commune (strain H4-8 / FGSC 9210) TaxID=578458 RepID=UPI00215EF0D7|nr:uncharacterized protein SCHCODRAFT_01249419 [Schizophyllum commune H4-8]KAI5886113.1 hypothetical protein SCHCODRAFT_01249419 [Schizophyllum commune H4-8]